mgnify:CR=1 FL=1
MIYAHLSKELRAQYKRRSIAIRKGDEVKIIRGKHAGKGGAISEVDLKNSVVLIDGLKIKRTIGTEKQIPIKPSKLVITNLNLGDNMRQRILLRKVKEVKVEKPKIVEPKPAEEKVEVKQEIKQEEKKNEIEKSTGAKVLARAKKGKEMGSGTKTRSAQKA